jgi:tetratricopeptide (TPR) repeat protein
MAKKKAKEKRIAPPKAASTAPPAISHRTTRWMLMGVIATAAIVLTLALYALKGNHAGIEFSQALPRRSAYTGSESCRPCHKREYDLWKGSHHERAMDVASDQSVLGDFNHTVFSVHGVESRFYRDGDKFMVRTQGPEGKTGDFEITHTFGYYPLQQYLVPFPGGRLQCLPIAWDVEKQRWYHLYPDAPIDPADWLYWTRAGQNWNGMCAECHSTNLKKNYDPVGDTYQTEWSEISVGCEACHGPGGDHIRWAETPEMGRLPVNNFALEVDTSDISAHQQIQICAPCHSRRSSLTDYSQIVDDLMDYGIAQLLSEGMYYADGQILEEVYVYGSFIQSKMYHRDVKCSDCHDVHSIKNVKTGNDLCLQCHQGRIYDTKAHHFHKQKSEPGQPIKDAEGRILFEVGTGAECVQCHMPGRYYMGVDYRPDHSLRIPRPDLSDPLQAPNACNRCHWDKSNQWSADHTAKWYGPSRRHHYGTVLAGGRGRNPAMEAELIRVVHDRLYPTIVRATALASLSGYETPASAQVMLTSLNDETALVRHTALRHMGARPPEQLVQHVGPLLYDPILGVRIEAARILAELPPGSIPPALQEAFKTALKEFKAAMAYSADFAASRHNMGNLHSSMGETDKAIAQFRKAIAIDEAFFPAKVNLAMLYNRLGQNDAAETLLRQVVADHPELHEIKYSLGLLLAEKKQYREAAAFLELAARSLPQRGRIHYNLGLLLSYLGEAANAEDALQTALSLEPGQIDYYIALADFYLKRQQWDKAEGLAAKMVQRFPGNPTGTRILALARDGKATSE